MHKICFNFHEVQLAYFSSLVACAFGVIAKKSLPNPTLRGFLPVLSYETLKFSLFFIGLNFGENQANPWASALLVDEGWGVV